MDDEHRKAQALAKTIDEMKQSDKYNVNNIDNDLQKERDEWRNKYDALLVKYEQKDLNWMNKYHLKSIKFVMQLLIQNHLMQNKHVLYGRKIWMN